MGLLMDRQFINPDTLQIGKPYLILQVQKIMMVDEPKLIARIWFNRHQDVWVVLPQHFAIRFGESSKVP
jgi:hypothetical protein